MVNKMTTIQYIFGFIFIVFFQMIITPRICIGNAYVDMAVILTVWVALVKGSHTGMFFGLGAGLLTGVLKPIELGWISFLLSATGFLVGNIKDKLIMEPLPVRILTLLIVALIYNIVFIFFTGFEMFFRNPSFIFSSAFLTAAYTTLVGAIVFCFLRYRYVLRNLF
ncbi:MAG: hypothetical protein B6D58_00330 [candidate division Zixibacteria bacterium 4484_95]|nr:MAG: hypothetical protein B6D58_00330 [candidate division Zixibacteria bacterium 4484_95]